jgi:hypothetical protein
MKRSLIAVFAAAAVLADCSGGGSSALPHAARSTSGATTFTVKIPARNPGARTPHYISSSTQSVSFSIASASYSELMLVTPDSPGCNTDSNGNRTCVLNANVPTGDNQTLLVKTFASTDGTGTPLSQNSIVISVASGKSNPVNLTLNGVVASIDFWTTPDALTTGTAGSLQYGWDGKDAAGNWIVGLPQYDVNGNEVLHGTFNVSDTTHFTWRNDSSGNLFLDYDGTAPITAPNVTLDVNSGEFTATHPVPFATPSPTPTPGTL